MDEIEYLEEYEDLILPTMSTQAANTKGRNRTNLVAMADDEDSSSIDQDIFDSLFDDNSDDESVMHKKGPAKLSQRSERSSRISRVSMDSLDMLVKELGEPFNPNADGSKSTNRSTTKQSNTKVTQPNKIVQKSTSTTTMIKGANSPTPVERNIKAKSVATVRPTVQQNLAQTPAAAKSNISSDNAVPTTRIIQSSSRSGSLQHSKITSGSVHSSKVASPTPSTSRKQISAATSTTGSNNLPNSSKSNTPMAASKRVVERSQTTIIKPEKPQIKDPAEDPLSLENIGNESDSDSDSFIYSDISADTFVTLSDVDYDERHIIDLSNDSNYDRANLDKIRGSTPSPTVSDDYKSDKEDSPAKMLSKVEEKSKEGSVLERNANETAKFRVRQYVDDEATTSRQRKQESPNNAHDKPQNVQTNTAAKDTLLERIDNVLTAASDNEEDPQHVEKHTDQVEPDMEVEVVTDNKEEAKEKKSDDMPVSTIACDSRMDGKTIAKPGVIQEPSTTETMEMDMGEIVEEVVEKENSALDNEIKEKFIETSEEIRSNGNTTNEVISVTTTDVVMGECKEKEESTVMATESVGEYVHQIEVISEQVVETVDNGEIDHNLYTQQSGTECDTNEHKVRELNAINADEVQEAEAVAEYAIECAVNKTPKVCEVDEVENELQKAEISNGAQLKLRDETNSESEKKILDKNINSKDVASEKEKDCTKVLVEKGNEQGKSDFVGEQETNEDLQSEQHKELCNLTAADTITAMEETENNAKKDENSTKNSNNQNDNEEDCATSSKNVKQLHEKEETKMAPIKKLRGTDKQHVSLRRSRTPMNAKLTESKSQNYDKLAEKGVSNNKIKEDVAKANDVTEDGTGDDTKMTDDSKADKLDEDADKDIAKETEKRSQTSRSKSNTPQVEQKIDGNKKDVRKSRYDKKGDVIRTDWRSERNERSQTPRGRKVQKTLNETVDVVENSQNCSEKTEVSAKKSSTEKDDDADKITTETTEEAQFKSEGETYFEKCKAHELPVREQITPKLDKRVRGLVVSLKKTDLSKVLNEKLLQKINTQAKSEMKSDLVKSETAANITVDNSKINPKEQELPTVTTKVESKELTPEGIDETEYSVKKPVEESSIDLKPENTTEKAKEDLKSNTSKDKSDTTRRDDKSGDKSKRVSRYERSRSKSRRDQSTHKSLEKMNEHGISVKVEDKAEHTSKYEKSVNKDNKDSRFEKFAGGAKGSAKRGNSTERSKRDSKYERSTDRAKTESKDEKHREKSKTDSKESTDVTKKVSKEEKFTESVKKDSTEKHEYKRKSDLREEQTKSFSKGSSEKAKGSKEEKSLEKSKRDSKEFTKPTNKDESKSKTDSKDERSADKVKSENEESTHRKKKDSKDVKGTLVSRYEKSIDRTKKDTKDEKSAVKTGIDSKERKSGKEVQIDSKNEKSPDRSIKLSKAENPSSDSKVEKTSATATKDDSKEPKTSEKSKSERVNKDSKNRNSETKSSNEEEKAKDILSEYLETTQEPKTKTEDDKTIDYRKMKWKNEKYTRKSKSDRDIQKPAGSELKAENESGSGAIETKRSNKPTSTEHATAVDKPEEQNTAVNEKLRTETIVDSNEVDNTQNSFEESDSKLEEPPHKSQKENLENKEDESDPKYNVNANPEERTGNEVMTAASTIKQNECCKSYNDNENTEANQVNKEERSIATTEKAVKETIFTESTAKADEKTTVTESTEKAEEIEATIESTDKNKDERIIAGSATEKSASKRGRFYKTREKRDKRELDSEGSSKIETKTKAREEESVDSTDKIYEKELEVKTVVVEKFSLEVEKELESSNKPEKSKTEIIESISESKVEPAAGAENIPNLVQATKVDEATTRRRGKSRRIAENAAFEVVEEKTDAKKEQEDAVKAVWNAEETEQNQTNVETLKETANTTLKETAQAEGDNESTDGATETEIANKITNQNAFKIVDKAKELSNKNGKSKIHEDFIEAQQNATTASAAEVNAKAIQQEFPTQQTTTTEVCDAVESMKESAAGSGSSSETKRNKHAPTFADILIISQSPQLQSADEDEYDGATRRSMRTRAADHSPSNKNEPHKKGTKPDANQTASSTSTNATQKLHKVRMHSGKSSTASYAARKRIRDTTTENNELEKSPSKKSKWESDRKYSRIHNDDVDTSEGEFDAAAASQQLAKVLSVRESPASKSAQEKQGKLTAIKDTKTGKSPAGVSGKAMQTTKQSSIASEIKQSVTGDNLNVSKTREKSLNASHSATKTETPELKRKQEHEKSSTKGTTTTSELNKKRKSELEQAQTHKSAVKQPANSSGTGASTTATRIDVKSADHAHASTTEEAEDPLQLPVKRFKRLQAIDSIDTLNISEQGKELKIDGLDNKTASAKRKSLRAVAPSDGIKTTDGMPKLTVKQTQHSQQQQLQQQQQQQHRGVAAKQVESTILSLKDRKIVVPNKSIKDAVSTDKSASKSPTKSPGSKVITFKEWLEQQKKRTAEDGGEDVLFEPDESAIRMDKILATTSELKRANTSASEASTAVRQKPKEPTAVQTPAVAEVRVSKDAKKKMNARDAAKRKREAAFTSDKVQSGAPGLTKQTPPPAKHGRIEKVVTPAPTQAAAAQFKRPSLPQRMPRQTTTRFHNRTPTPAELRASSHSTQQQARQATLQQRLDTKVKLRKLCVRINRSTVAAYFKNLNLNKLKEHIKHFDTEHIVSTTLQSTIDNTSTSVMPPTEPLQQRSPLKDPLALPKKSVVIQPTITTTTAPQLPTLTARPTVIAASEISDPLAILSVAMPALTKVPPSVVEKSPTKSQEYQEAAPPPEVTDQQFGSTEDLSLLTPMKCVTTLQSPNDNSTRSQQQQQQKEQMPATAPEAMREKRASTASSSDTSITQRFPMTGMQTASSSSSSTITAASSIANSETTTQLPFTPVVPKEELVDEHTLSQQEQTANAITTGASADTTNTTNSLASRTLAIAAATNSALNQTPTNDASSYYGLTPTQLDTNGTRLYSFLHPAKYNRNHGCVLLDYCCPNLDGPMPAIDPTRIHAQVQAGVRELPAYIVMTTKLITRADLEANKNVIPASIRQKVEKITADATHAATNHSPAATVSGVPHTTPVVVPPTVPVSKPTSTSLTPTITALQKHLPSTTIITPKMMPAIATATMATTQGASPTNVTTQLPTVSDYQRSLLRTSVRQFDARLKKYYYRIAMLSFSDRQSIIDGIINSTTLTPKDVDCAVRLLDEYAAKINAVPFSSATNVAKTTASASASAMQSVSKAITTQTTNTVVRTTTIQQQVKKQNTQISKNQVAVLDKDNSLLGYQLAAAPMPMSKSTISTRSSIMSTSVSGMVNTTLPNVATTSSGGFASLKSTQDSPRIFYTKPPMQTSTPNTTATSSANTSLNDSGKTISRRSTPRIGREVTIRQIPQKLNSVTVSSTTATATPPNARRLPTLPRNPHITAGSSAEKNITETITTRSAVTISNAPKRMTRATAAAKVIVITQNSDGNSAAQDECILPDGHQNTEIKREHVDDDFVGGN